MMKRLLSTLLLFLPVILAAGRDVSPGNEPTSVPAGDNLASAPARTPKSAPVTVLATAPTPASAPETVTGTAPKIVAVTEPKIVSVTEPKTVTVTMTVPATVAATVAATVTMTVPATVAATVAATGSAKAPEPAPAYGVVRLSVCNMRQTPDYDAEMVSQALLGTPVHILHIAEKNDWPEIQGPEGYTGWVHKAGIQILSKEEYSEWNAAEKVVVTALFGTVFSSPSRRAATGCSQRGAHRGKAKRTASRIMADGTSTANDGTSPINTATLPATESASADLNSDRSVSGSDNAASISSGVVSDVVGGDRLKYLGSKGRYWKVGFPDGREGYLDKRLGERESVWRKHLDQSPEAILRTALSMNGFPYLWAGMSPKGMDCSGFVRTTLAMHDIIIPRDASQQAPKGERIELFPATGADANTDTGSATTTADAAATAATATIGNGATAAATGTATTAATATAPRLPDCSRLQPGDLLFFGRRGENGGKDRVSHVAIYLGDKQFIHSLGLVCIASMDPESPIYDAYNTGRLLFASRILPWINRQEGLTTTATNPFYNE